MSHKFPNQGAILRDIAVRLVDVLIFDGNDTPSEKKQVLDLVNDPREEEMRSRQPHYEMCKSFKRFYEEKFGGIYVISSLDAKEAHEVFVLNGEIDSDTIKAYSANYFADQFEGWTQRRHPAWLFFKHFNSFAPRVEKVSRKGKPKEWCPECETIHGIGESCPALGKASGIVADLAQAKRI